MVVCANITANELNEPILRHTIHTRIQIDEDTSENTKQMFDHMYKHLVVGRVYIPIPKNNNKNASCFI